MHSGTFRARQIAVFVFFLLALSTLIIRLFYLQVLQHNFYYKLANQQHTVSVEIQAKRGAIFDSHMRVLALNLNSDSVFANPRVVKNKKFVAGRLASILKISENVILQKLARDKGFLWIKRKISDQESSQIKSLKIEGIGVVRESKRFYPNKSLACHVLGTADIDNKGLEGLELYYNKYLKGESGWLISTQDAKRKILESYQYEFIPPKNGFNIVLTIDEVIQNIAERELYNMYKKYNAKGASIVVMDPRSGDILALANFPNYDLNDVSKRPTEAIRDRAINDFFEPGSVFKIVTASAVLEENAAKLDDKFYCENGEWKLGRRTLHDHTPHGILTFKEIIEKSSNIGTVKVAARLGPAKMYKYMKAFGFYDRTGIDLPGEVVGINREPSKWSGTSMYAIPMGQEVTTTAMQLACAVSAIANNGFLVKPRVVKEIVNDNGKEIREPPARVFKKVISPTTAVKMRSILMGVVETGTGKKAKPEDYNAGGKTGTAQKIEGGTYSHNRFIASFIGFAPVQRPILSVVVCVDEPHPVYYGGDVAAPVFKNVVNESIKYLSAKGAI